MMVHSGTVVINCWVVMYCGTVMNYSTAVVTLNRL